jgi:hypothetical protein
MNLGSRMTSISAITALIGMMKKAANRTEKDARAEVLTMDDLIYRKYLIEKFSDTGAPAVSEMGKGYDLGIAAALRVVKNAPSVNRWIPCSERMPENGEEVLVWFEYFRYGDYNCMYQTYGIGTYSRRYDSWLIDHETGWQKLRVFAWMPLPEPPEEGAEDA